MNIVKRTIDKLHIVKVFLTHDVCYFGAFLSDENLTCIWDRYNSQNFKILMKN